MKLFPIDEEIMDFMKTINHKFISPTDIGLKFGKPYNGASSWGSRKMKKLLKKGLIEKNERGHYRAK